MAGNDDISPEVMIDEKEVALHKLDSLSLLLYTLLLTLTVLTVWLFKHRRIRFLHETGLALFYGLIIGAVVRYGFTSFSNPTVMRVKPINTVELTNGTHNGPPDVLWLMVKTTNLLNRTMTYGFKGEVKDANSEFDQKATFDPEIFFNILLPPIIFHAGYSMKKRFFFRNIGAILLFAFVGTTISTFTVAGIMYWVTRMSTHLAETFKFLDTLRFGALISATDPVTILAIFTDLNVDVNLYAMVFGESVLNDAVAMVVTRTLEDYEKSAESGDQEAMPTYLVILKSVGEFVGIFGGSFLVGAVMGCSTALITKFTRLRNHPQLESTLFVLMSYSTFLIAEVLNLTGIVAVLSCGICQAHYTYNNMSNESRIVTKQFFGLLNFMAENFIFCYVGVSMFTFQKHNFDAVFIVGAFLAIIVGRAINIYPLSFLLNLGRKSKITWNLQHMLFLSGLRGAIAFALAIRNTYTDARKMILTATLVIVAVTVVLCGGSTMSLLTYLGIPIGLDNSDDADCDADDKTPLSNSNSPEHNRYNSVQEPGTGLPMGCTPADKSVAAQVWSGFDTKYMKPLLTHSNPTLMETMPECCLPVARVLTSNEQLSRHPAMVNRTGRDPVINDDVSSADGMEIAINGEVVEESPKKSRDSLKLRLPSNI